LDFLEKRRAKNSAYQQQQQQQQQCTAAAGPDSAAAAADTAAAADSSVSDITIDVACDIELQEKKQQQQKTAGSSTAASSSGSSSGGSSGSSGSSSQIHACVILDPIYRLGEVVGYVVQRTYVSPQHVQGAPKLVLKDVLDLLKAEGRDILAHGLSPAHSVKSGGAPGGTVRV
jgi:hypothetical protein